MASGRLLEFSRKFSTQKTLRASLAEPLKVTEPDQHAVLTMTEANKVVETSYRGFKMWRTLFFIVCCPAMGVGYLNVLLNDEHKRPEFVKYPHLRIRNKKYPWKDGVKTLFHNPHANALPDGYEAAAGHH